MFANIEDQLLTFTAESSLPWRETVLVYYTVQVLTLSKEPVKLKILGWTSVQYTTIKKICVDSTDSHNDKSSLPRSTRQNSTFHLIIKLESSYVH